MQFELDYSDMERFWSKVQADQVTSCWNWTSNLTSDKGGGIRLPSFHLNDSTGKHHKITARRLAYFLHFGSEPKTPVGLSCGNPLCVNPWHFVTDLEKKRTLRVYDTASKKNVIDEKLVRRVVNLRDAGRSTPQIARRTGLNQGYVCQIIKMTRLCREGRLQPKPQKARA